MPDRHRARDRESRYRRWRKKPRAQDASSTETIVRAEDLNKLALYSLLSCTDPSRTILGFFVREAQNAPPRLPSYKVSLRLSDIAKHARGLSLGVSRSVEHNRANNRTAFMAHPAPVPSGNPHRFSSSTCPHPSRLRLRP